MPSLIEPGTKYFFNETLKNVNKERNRINTLLFNLALFVMFILIVYGILSFRKKNKLSDEEMKKKQEELRLRAKFDGTVFDQVNNLILFNNIGLLR